MTQRRPVWVVDDDASIRFVLVRALEQAGHDVLSFEGGMAVVKELRQGSRPGVIVTDIRMPGMSGIELLDLIQRHIPNVPVILMTAHTDLEAAVSSYKGGAYEYLPKPFDIDSAVALIERANQDVQPAPPARTEKNKETSLLLGEAPAMQDVFRAIGRLSGSDLNVLISGESGTGKELVAKSIYETSARAKAPLVALNMAAIPAELLESELFGHEKGAFTGATQMRRGHFEQADGGTLFLDEIGDMPQELQTRLLRVLSDGRFYRVGGHTQLAVDVRIIAATNQNLEERVADGLFREDLYHRLNVIQIKVPSLASRREDIPMLIESFLSRLSSELNVEAKAPSRAALDVMVRYNWAGNVRQLENVCRWITVMAPGKVVGVDDLPSDLTSPQAARNEPAANAKTDAKTDWTTPLRQLVRERLGDGDSRILDSLSPQFEKLMIETALDHTRGHKQEAARRLGWGRNTLTRKLKELGL